MSCMLSIAGEKFDVVSFIKATGLKPYSQNLKGEPKFKTKLEGEKNSIYSGVFFE